MFVCIRSVFHHVFVSSYDQDLLTPGAWESVKNAPYPRSFVPIQSAYTVLSAVRLA